MQVKQTAAGVASFEFAELCSTAAGAADFLAIARAFHTVIIHHIPRLTPERLPEVRRLITLIDVLYDHRCRRETLCCYCQTPRLQRIHAGHYCQRPELSRGLDALLACFNPGGPHAWLF